MSVELVALEPGEEPDWEGAERSIGTPYGEADPLSRHGWMCRLVDAGVLGAAGFHEFRKTELEPA